MYINDYSLFHKVKRAHVIFYMLIVVSLSNNSNADVFLGC